MLLKYKNIYDTLLKVSVKLMLSRYYFYFLMFYPIIIMFVFKGSHQISLCLDSDTNTIITEESNSTKSPVYGTFLFLASIGAWFYFFGGVDIVSFINFLDFINGSGSATDISDTTSVYSNRSISEISEIPKDVANLEENSAILLMHRWLDEKAFRDMLLFHSPDACSFYTTIELENLSREVKDFQQRLLDRYIVANYDSSNLTEEEKINVSMQLTQEFNNKYLARTELFSQFCSRYPDSAGIIKQHTPEIKAAVREAYQRDFGR